MNKHAIRVLLGVALTCGALSAIPSGAQAASLTSCPSFSNQVNDTVSRFDAICGLSCPAWVEVGGVACEKPDVIGLLTAGFAMKPLGATGCLDDDGKPIGGADCSNSMNDLMDKIGDDETSDQGDRFNDILTDPDFGKDIVDPEKSPGIAAPTDEDGDLTVVVTDPDNPENPTTEIKYKKICKVWTNDDVYIPDPDDPDKQIVNPKLPDQLKDIVAAGGYITPTQVCLVVQADDSGEFFLRRQRSLAARRVLAPLARSARLRLNAASDYKATTFEIKSKSVLRVYGGEGEPKKRLTCGYNPFVVLSSVQVKDPANPNAQLTVGQASGRICRVVVFLQAKPPALSAKEKRYVKKGFGVIAFRLVGLPSKGSREVPVPMPFGRIKILGTSAKPVNANSGGYVLTDKNGIAKWIGTIPKTGIYAIKGTWPFYKNQTSRFRLKTTVAPKKKR